MNHGPPPITVLGLGLVSQGGCASLHERRISCNSAPTVTFSFPGGSVLDGSHMVRTFQVPILMWDFGPSRPFLTTMASMGDYSASREARVCSGLFDRRRWHLLSC